MQSNHHAHHDRRRQRSIRRNLWALLQIIGHVLAPWRRASRERWGARPDEPDPGLPGEALIPHPKWEYTHAVSIATSSDAVWPWVVQLGQGRGGFYSFERLENAVGCKIVNADDVLPAHQTLSVGDVIKLHPTGPALRVHTVKPGSSLVLRGEPTDDTTTVTDNIWAFHLVADAPGTCRLVERGKTTYGSSTTDRLFFSPLLVEPIGFVMSREMLLGIKERAERRASRS